MAGSVVAESRGHARPDAREGEQSAASSADLSRRARSPARGEGTGGSGAGVQEIPAPDAPRAVVLAWLADRGDARIGDPARLALLIRAVRAREVDQEYDSCYSCSHPRPNKPPKTCGVDPKRGPVERYGDAPKGCPEVVARALEGQPAACVICGSKLRCDHRGRIPWLGGRGQDQGEDAGVYLMEGYLELRLLGVRPNPNMDASHLASVGANQLSPALEAQRAERGRAARDARARNQGSRAARELAPGAKSPGAKSPSAKGSSARRRQAKRRRASAASSVASRAGSAGPSGGSPSREDILAEVYADVPEWLEEPLGHHEPWVAHRDRAVRCMEHVAAVCRCAAAQMRRTLGVMAESRIPLHPNLGDQELGLLDTVADAERAATSWRMRLPTAPARVLPPVLPRDGRVLEGVSSEGSGDESLAESDSSWQGVEVRQEETERLEEEAREARAARRRVRARVVESSAEEEEQEEQEAAPRREKRRRGN